MPRGHRSLAMWGIPFYDGIQSGWVMSQPINRFDVLQTMMVWGDGAAEAENISREQCDKWSSKAHQKACAAVVLVSRTKAKESSVWNQ